MVAKIDSAREEAATEKNAPEDDIKKKGLSLIVYDLKQKKLIPTKVLFIVVLSSKHWIWSILI